MTRQLTVDDATRFEVTLANGTRVDIWVGTSGWVVFTRDAALVQGAWHPLLEPSGLPPDYFRSPQEALDAAIAAGAEVTG